MNTKDTKQWYKKWWIWLIVGLVFIGVMGALGKKDVPMQTSRVKKEEASSNVQAETKKEEAPVATSEPALPELEKKFIALIDEGKSKYSAASTDLQKSDVIRSRDVQICTNVGAQFTGWIGTIKDIGANGEGKAYVSVELSSSVKLTTWNNAVSDYADNTLIPKDSSLYDTLLKMKKGTQVTASGNFIATSDSCVKTSNLTQTFRALDPDYIVNFTDIRSR